MPGYHKFKVEQIENILKQFHDGFYASTSSYSCVGVQDGLY